MDLMFELFISFANNGMLFTFILFLIQYSYLPKSYRWVKKDNPLAFWMIITTLVVFIIQFVWNFLV